jgi:hypothetical protein
VKFLVWQFAAYALCAFGLGVLAVALWLRPERLRQRATDARLRARLVEGRAAAEAVRDERDALLRRVDELSARAAELDDLKRATALLGADRDAAARRERRAVERVAELESLLSTGREADAASHSLRAELSVLREELDRRLASHHREREVLIAARTDAVVRADRLESELMARAQRHDTYVVAAQQERTELMLRIERLERKRSTAPMRAAGGADALRAALTLDEDATDAAARDASWGPILPAPTGESDDADRDGAHDRVGTIDADTGTIRLTPGASEPSPEGARNDETIAAGHGASTP